MSSCRHNDQFFFSLNLKIHYPKLLLPIVIFYLSYGLTFAIYAQTQTLVAYLPANGTTDPPNVEGLGIAGNDLSRGSGIIENTGTTFNSRGWDGANLSEAQANNEYLEWGFTVISPIDLATLDIRYDRSSTGPTQIDIHLAVNGGGFVSVFTDADVDVIGEESFH